jgi:hypothetical protein
MVEPVTGSVIKARSAPANGCSLPCTATLRDLASDKTREVCVVPVAFVSDHVETLGEIDHEAREEARKLGITQFEMSAGLNDSPKFISALAQLVMDRTRRRGFTPIHRFIRTGRQVSAPELLTAAGD